MTCLIKLVAAFAFLLISISVFTASRAIGIECSRHPLYRKGFVGEIVRSWQYEGNNPKSQLWAKSAYVPRYEHYHLEPKDDPGSSRFMGLDYFATWPGNNVSEKFLTIHYQRQAKTYLYVVSHKQSEKIPLLNGWNPESWVRKPRNAARVSLEFGVGERRNKFGMYGSGFIFSRMGEKVQVPSAKFIKENVKNLETSGAFVILIAEKNGSHTRRPRRPAGMVIQPGELCPEALHRVWKIKGFDGADFHSRRRYFSTWHPLLDPCYFCSYGHEHGSDAAGIMGFRPRYDYVAWKNENQDESHKGFKDFVLDLPTHWFYFGVHAHLSTARRFKTRFHTLVLAAVNKETKQKELLLSFKADYGALVVRRAKGGLMGVTSNQEILRKNLGFPRRHRVTNVVNIKQLDPRFKYRDSPHELLGGYETWATQPICSETLNGREPTFDVKDPPLGLKYPDLNQIRTVILGHKKRNQLYQSLGINREFRAKDFLITDDACLFKLGNIYGRRKRTGKFYTDPYGKKLYSVPGKNRVYQYIKPGFKLNVTGRFEAIDPWQGLYFDDYKGRFANIMNGLVEGEN